MSWLDDFPGTQAVWTAVADLNGQARGKRLPANRAGKLYEGTAKMPLSALSLDIFGDDVADSPLVFESGDKDGFLRPTERGGINMPWLASQSVLLPMSMEHGQDKPFVGDPRNALKRVLARFDALGWKVVAATELEFFLIDEDASVPLAERLRAGGDILGLRSLEAYDAFLTELYKTCASLGIPTETATSESGKGQFEITLTHGDALAAADNSWLLKMVTKGLAHKNNMIATFMAKPFVEDAGNGLHMHFSVLDSDGANVFDDGTQRGSDRMRHAVSGCLSTMRDATLVFAPHQNSYERLVPGSHAPTKVSWGYENRTAAIRIPDGPGASRRIEHRVAGGDVNPYLLFAAVLGGALVGIEDGIDPPPPMTGNVYDTALPELVRDWPSAVDVFSDSPGMRRIFHTDLIDQFVRTKRQEIDRLSEMDSKARIALYIDRV